MAFVLQGFVNDQTKSKNAMAKLRNLTYVNIQTTRRSESQSDIFQCSNSMPGFDDDFIQMDVSDTLVSSILPNMIDFPNPREIGMRVF